MSEEPAMVTIPRIASALSSLGYATQITDDVVWGTWNGFEIRFDMHDGQLRSIGHWGHTISSQILSSARLALNDWNRERVWPTGILHGDDDLTIHGRVTIDTHEGLTTKQLSRVLDAILTAQVGFLTALGVPPADQDES